MASSASGCARVVRAAEAVRIVGVAFRRHAPSSFRDGGASVLSQVNPELVVWFECCAYPRMGAALLHLMRDGAVLGAAWSCVRAAAADLEQVKGVRWMPWRQEAMKDVARCDKPRGDASDR